MIRMLGSLDLSVQFMSTAESAEDGVFSSRMSQSAPLKKPLSWDKIAGVSYFKNQYFLNQASNETSIF